MSKRDPYELVEAARGENSVTALQAVATLRRQWAAKRERELVQWAQDPARHLTVREVAATMGVSTKVLRRDYPNGWEGFED